MVLQKIKSIMKESPFMMQVIARIYRFVHYNNAWKYRIWGGNTISLSSAFLKGTSFDISGKNNIIIVGPKARLFNCKIKIIGDGNRLEIKSGSTIISNTSFWMQHGSNEIIIGHDSTIEGGSLAAIEGTKITVGDDCMFSSDIEIRTGDSHSIINAVNEKRINPSDDILIGDHVWLTAHVRVMKGAVIPNNSIVGNSAIVTSKFDKENSVYAGIPAKHIKDNINWDRYLR